MLRRCSISTKEKPQMKVVAPRLLAAVMVAVLLAGAAGLAAQMKQETLYKRLGGFDALAAVTDDFIGRLASDKQLSKFFVGHSKDSLGHIRQLIVD
jgi:hypothetical protein